jgi:hypothetical protein
MLMLDILNIKTLASNLFIQLVISFYLKSLIERPKNVNAQRKPI